MKQGMEEGKKMNHFHAPYISHFYSGFFSCILVPVRIKSNWLHVYQILGFPLKASPQFIVFNVQDKILGKLFQAGQRLKERLFLNKSIIQECVLKSFNILSKFPFLKAWEWNFKWFFHTISLRHSPFLGYDGNTTICKIQLL